MQLDADGQHDPADAKRLVDLVADGTADLVVGSRFESTIERCESSAATRSVGCAGSA